MSSAHLTRVRKWLLQSPPAEWAIQQIRELLIGALRQGPIPLHIAFVMDGNRRYAWTNKIEVVEGHNHGFEALARILEVCYKFGVKVVTVYAFSIENFNRPKYEVEALMQIAKTRLAQLAQHGSLLHTYGAKVQILGHRDMLRDDVNELMDHIIDMTKDNDRAILNVCCPYTSRDEITTAIQDTVIDFSRPLSSTKRPFSASHISRNIRARQPGTNGEGPPRQQNQHEFLAPNEDESSDSLSSSTTVNPGSAAAGALPELDEDERSAEDVFSYPDPETITPQTLSDHMFTSDAPPLDILIRTSGVERLSDFMLWQCHQNTSIVFLKTLWPAFDLWHFLPVLWEWQWQRRRALEADRKVSISQRPQIKVS